MLIQACLNGARVRGEHSALPCTPEELASAAAEAFNALSYTLRKEHVRQVETAKAQATRERRIAAIVAGLIKG